MIALTWQTLLILTIAYFLGCIVGCLARKMVGARPVAGVQPAFETAVPAPAPPPAREVPRAAVAAVAAEPAPVVSRPIPGAAAPKAFRRADFDTPDDVVPSEEVRSEEVSEAPPPPPRAPSGPPPDVPPPAAVPPPISAAEAVAAAVAERMAVPTPPVVTEPVPDPAPTPEPPPSPEPAAVDDLTRIRGIDTALAAKLNELGVTRYAEIAAWTSEDVHTASDLLGFDGRIERENWIEQAQILARGGATSYATGLASSALRSAASAVEPPPPPERGPDVSTRAAFAEPRPAAPPPPAPAAAMVSDRDHLQRIGGISAEIEIGLNAHAVTRYSQIAGWSADDVQKFESLIGSSGRISRENWIEQAQILARGGATAYSRTFDTRGGPPEPIAVVVPVAAAPVALEAPPTVVVADTVPPAPEAPPTFVVVDAAQLPSPPTEPAENPPVEQPSVAETSERVADLSGMRSVRSEAFRAPDSMAPPSPAAPEDLKRIRGIGLLIERKLNAMGVSTYEQIANWTADDVSTVNARLEFKGRIERENWIEQARILASGGHTDFSRRFERGEA